MAAPFRLVTPYSRLAMPEINIGLYPDVGASRFLADRGPIGLFTGLTGSIMTSAGAYGIGWATHICDAQRDVVLQKVISIDWNHYPAGSFRAIDDTLNSLHRPVALCPLQNSLDVIHSVCRGINFEQDYQAIIGLSDARSDWLRQASENLQRARLPQRHLLGCYGNGGVRFILGTKYLSLNFKFPTGKSAILILLKEYVHDWWIKICHLSGNKMPI